MRQLYDFILSKMTPKVKASIFILGTLAIIIVALFKLFHWPGAATVLIIAMVVESVIFLLSAIVPDFWNTNN